MSFAAIAVGVGAAAAVGSAASQAASASGAANASRKSLNQGYGIASETLDQNNRDISRALRPYVQSGLDYSAQLQNEMSGPLARQYGWNQYVKDAGLAPGTTQASFLQEYTPAQFGRDIGQPGFTLGDLYRSMTPADFKSTYGYDIKNALQQFTGADLENTPGYQFRLNQGLQANDRLAAARGGVLGGGQLKAQQRYAQDYAANEFQNAYERDLALKDLALGQYNTAFDQNQSDLARKAGLYYGEAGYKQQLGQNQLANFFNNWDAANKQQLQRYGMLSGLAAQGQDAATALAGMKQGNAHQLVNAATGGATAQSQNAWNAAGARNSAVSGLASNLTGLAGMYMASRGGFGGASPTGYAGGGNVVDWYRSKMAG